VSGPQRSAVTESTAAGDPDLTGRRTGSGVWSEPLGFGVYVHIPFCARRCDYCAFATWDDKSHLVSDYVDAVILEIERAAAETPVATSVFFGGGTPSLLSSSELTRILNAIHRTCAAEVTVECNPDTVDESKLAAYRQAGVNRLSFGVQSMVPHVLEALGRTHDPGNVRSAVRSARVVGFDNINLDLIYGAVGESVHDWRTTVKEALELTPEHISAYGLTVEPGTPLATATDRHPDDDDQADKYHLADALLESAGLVWYEISNFSRPGYECRHNAGYWRQANYKGFGCAAHSHLDGTRSWNVRTPERYIGLVREQRSAVASREVLDADERADERDLLALRTAQGVPVDRRGIEVAEALPENLVEIRSDTLHLTRAGRLVANDLWSRLSDR